VCQPSRDLIICAACLFYPVYEYFNFFSVPSPSTPAILLPRWLLTHIMCCTPFRHAPRRIPVPNRLRPRTATAFSSAAAATGIFVSRSEFVHYFDYYYVIIFIAIADTMSVNPSLPPPPPPRQSSATPPRTYSRAFRLCHRYSCKSRRPCRCKLATSADPAASVVVRLVAAA